MGNTWETPKTLKEKGFVVLDTSEDNLTGVVIPLCRSNKPMRGTLQMVVEGGEDVDLAKDMVFASPEPTAKSLYRVRPSIYVSSTDKLITFNRLIGLDGVMAIIALFDEDDVSMEWEK